MFYDTQALSLAGAKNNEDAVGAGKTTLFVIDGATGLNSVRCTSWASDAAWFAQMTAELLTAELSEDDREISEIVSGIMTKLKLLWPGKEEDMPSAGIAIFRVRKNTLEYFGLGDCSASVLLENGQFRSFEEQRLKALDQAALGEMTARCRECGCTMQEARQLITDTLIRNRALKNTPQGYWCLDPSGVGILHARKAVLPLEKCRSVFLCTDGYEQLIGFGEVKTLEELHKRTIQEGGEELAKRLFALQEADIDMLKLPRFKFRDDTTVAAGRISHGEE